MDEGSDDACLIIDVLKDSIGLGTATVKHVSQLYNVLHVSQRESLCSYRAGESEASCVTIDGVTEDSFKVSGGLVSIYHFSELLYEEVFVRSRHSPVVIRELSHLQNLHVLVIVVSNLTHLLS